jgi:DNA repair protein RadC
MKGERVRPNDQHQAEAQPISEAPPYRVAECPAMPPKKPSITGPEAAYLACRTLSRRRVEEMHVLILDAKHSLIRRRKVAQGSVNFAPVHPREIFAPALRAMAVAVILVHNHPSGDPEPSREDITVTKRLKEVGELIGIRVLDHVVVAKGGWVSLNSRGLL